MIIKKLREVSALNTIDIYAGFANHKSAIEFWNALDGSESLTESLRRVRWICW